MLSSAHARAGKRPLPQRQIQNARGPILIDSAFIEQQKLLNGRSDR